MEDSTEHNNNNNTKMQIVMLGGGGVGKSSLTEQFVNSYVTARMILLVEIYMLSLRALFME